MPYSVVERLIAGLGAKPESSVLSRKRPRLRSGNASHVLTRTARESPPSQRGRGARRGPESPGAPLVPYCWPGLAGAIVPLVSGVLPAILLLPKVNRKLFTPATFDTPAAVLAK